MKKLLYLLPLAAVLTLSACEREPDGPGDDLTDQAAFILGHNFGEGIHLQVQDLEGRDTQIDRDMILAGFRAGLRGDSLPYSRQQVDSIMVAFEAGMVERAGAVSRAEGEAYIAEFEAREGVVTTASGLRYRVIEEGEGAPPDSNDVVTIHYEGRLPDGEVFDSSQQRGQPARFPVDGVVPGFSEALQLMAPGSRYEIVLPPELGYGDQAPPAIGAGRTLIFEIQLLEVERR